MQVGYEKLTLFDQYLASSRPSWCYQHGAAGPWKVVTLIGGSKWRSLLMAGDDDEVFMTRSLIVTRRQ